MENNHKVNPFIWNRIKKVNPFIEFNLEPEEELRLIMQTPGVTNNVRQNAYYITSFGNVYSTLTVPKYDPNAKAKKKSIRTIKEGQAKDYQSIDLLDNSNTKKRNTYTIQRLVLSQLKPELVPKNAAEMEVNHIDYKRDNNHIENLEWVTTKENGEWSACNKRKLKDEDIIKIHNIMVDRKTQFDTTIYPMLMEKYGVSRDTLNDIKYCSGPYKFLKTDYNLFPPEERRLLTDEEAIELRKQLIERNCSLIEFSKNSGIGTYTLNNVLFCKGPYKSIADKVEPIEPYSIKK